MTAQSPEPQPSAVYVIGDSHVRHFSFHSGCMPLYIGAGFDNCFLTGELAERTRKKLQRNLDLLAGDVNVLLVFGEPDVRFQIEDRFGTRALGNEQAIAAAVGRYADTIVQLRNAMPQRRIAAMSCIPSTRPEYCRLSATYDRKLGALLRAENVTCVDIRPQLIDHSTQLLRPEFDADGIHLSIAALPAVIRALKENKLLDASAGEQPDFHWSYNYRIPVDTEFETRLWGDKPRSAIADEVVHYLAHNHSADKGRRWHVIDCAEGYLAFGLATCGFRRIIGSEPDPKKLLMAHRAARLFRSFESPVTFTAHDHLPEAADFAVFYPWSAYNSATIIGRLTQAALRGTVCYALVSSGCADQMIRHQGDCRADLTSFVARDAGTALIRVLKA